MRTWSRSAPVEPSPRPEAAIARVVLVGMMGAGKTEVGAALAARLGWQHLDLDREIAREAGRSVAEIFAGEGEAGFRAREARCTRGLATRREVVLSPGGGWAVQPGLLEALGEGTLSVWLQVSPEEALRRVAPAAGERPLLAGPDPLGTLRRLLAERAPHYARATLHLSTDGRSPGAVAEDIHTWFRHPDAVGRGAGGTEFS
jgi:shikimate kinase